MGMRSAIVLVVCAVTFLFAVSRGSGRRRGANGLSFGEEDAKVTILSGAEEEMMEQIWTNCKLELLGIKVVMRASDLLIPDSIAGDFTEPLKEDMQETLARLSPDMKCPLIDCLIRQSLLHPADNPRNRYATNFPRVLNQDSLLRRRLADQPVQRTSPASASSLASALRPRHQIQTPIAAPASAPAPPPNPNPHLGVIPHAPVPSPAPTVPSIPEDDLKDLSPTPLPHGYLEPEVVHPIPQLPVAPPEQKSISKQMIIIVVVVTATATFTLAALCFCCCNRYVGNNYQTVNGQKDDKPLLSLSLSDFSGSSLHKDKVGSSSFNPRQSDQVSSFATTADGHSAASSSNESTNAPGNPFLPAAPSPPSLKPPPGKTSAPPPPPPLPKPKPAPPPPAVRPPPPKGGPPPPKGPRPQKANSSSSAIPPAPSKNSINGDDNSDGAKIKLKPFFWDKVNANPDQSMVWHQIKSGSFQFNEEMIETLFGYNAADKLKNDAKKDLGNNSSSQRIQILDPKKSQNLAISLKAQNVKVEEVCDALVEGNELPVELLQTLLRMAPTTDEELKLRLFNDDSVFLGPAEQFLKNIVNIPFAFKRIEALLFMTTLQEESSSVNESFTTLEEACMELRNSRLFLKLLEAVLKTGNRMNDGTFRGGAQAFKLDTLLKLSDVKGADGKTTLLHFVVQEIIRSEGRRAMRVARENRSNSNITISSFNSDDFAEDVTDETEDQYGNIGLRAVSSLSGELENVKKAAGLDADALTSSVANLGNRLVKTKEFLNTDMRNLEEESGFHNSLKAFVEHAEADITRLLDEEKGIRLLVKSTSDYFHGNSGRNEGLRLFVVVRDFLGILNKVCKEVTEAPKKMMKESRSKDNPVLQPISEPRQLLFPAIKDRRMDDFSSEDEDD